MCGFVNDSRPHALLAFKRLAATVYTRRGEISTIGMLMNSIFTLGLVVTERPGNPTLFVRQNFGFHPVNSDTFLSEFLKGFPRLLTCVFKFPFTYRFIQFSEDKEILQLLSRHRSLGKVVRS